MTTPLTILTGFLGAGKTTLLNRIIHADHGLKLAVLVNDFGAVNIDSALVAATSVDGDTVSLSNGCICCTIRGDLLGAVAGLFERDDPPEYIILETSGVSDPLEVAMTFRDVPQMRALVHIDSIVSLIDAANFLDYQREHAVLAMNQIGVADLVVLNKVDLVADGQLAEVEATARRLVRGVRVFHTTHADVPLELLLGVGAYDPARLVDRPRTDVHVHAEDDDGGHDHHHHHTDHTTVFHTYRWEGDEPFNVAELRRQLARLPVGVYRMKGFIATDDAPGVRQVLHVVGRRVDLRPDTAWDGDGATHNTIVAIGRADEVRADEIDPLLTAALASNAPKGELDRLARHVRGWFGSA